MNENKAELWPEEKLRRWYQEHPVIPSRDYVKTLVPRIKALGERAGFRLEKYGEASYTTNSEAVDVVDDDTLYGSPNHDGVLLMSEMGPATGRVRSLFKHFTTASFTTEYCDIDLTDETPDAERVDPQMAAIRGVLRSSILAIHEVAKRL